MTNVKRLKPRLRIAKRETRENKTVRFSSIEIEQIQRAANRYAEGDFSEYVRYAAMNFVPTRDDLEVPKEPA